MVVFIKVVINVPDQRSRARDSVIAAASEVILFAISNICRISGYCNTDGSPWALSWVWRSMTSVVAIENQHLRMRSLPRAWRTAAQRSA